MRKYWSNSKVAKWIRGTNKIECGTAEEWYDWQKASKAQSPIRYWIAEELLDRIQDVVYWPFDKLHGIKYYINNRFITRTHALTAHPRDIKPGQWHDVGNRFLPCLFNELVNYVEVELAWWHLAWSPEERPKYNMPWWAVGWWRVRTWRCPQAGLDNLEWQRNLTFTSDEVSEDHPSIGKRTPQAENADQILSLYKWWTEIRPTRPDPYDASGWTEYCDRKREEFGDDGIGILMNTKDPELKKFGDNALQKISEIEKAYDDEDTEMLIRLIKVRDSLWT
jgi:hypothetical protein